MAGSYRIRKFTDAGLSELLRQFRAAVWRTFPNDAGLADEIEEQLVKKRKPELTVFQTCQDVFSRQGGILAQKVFHAVTISQHADQLMNRNSRALHTGLAVADIRIN